MILLVGLKKKKIHQQKDKCFQYTVTVAINHEEIKRNLQRIIKIKSFINKYNWNERNFLSEIDEWENSRKNVTIALNVLYDKKEKIYPAYVSKHNANCDTQVNLLIISNGEK